VSLAWKGYRALAPALGAAAPLLGWLAPGAARAGWRERLGEAAAGEPAPGPAHAWIHAASLGEAVAVGGLLGALRSLQPAARFRLTATTRAGRERLAALGDPASLAPLDAPGPVARFLGRVRPRRLILLETELWPHWLLAARRAAVPVAVLSARLSPRSLARYRWLGPEWAELVAGLAAVLCQSEGDRDRFLALGARPERARVVGNLKSDGLPEPASDRGAARARLGLDPERPLLVLGCLRPGEGAPLARAWLAAPAERRRGWQVVAVPRHARAATTLRREIKAAGAPALDAWGWDARAGVLRDYYAVADAAFVGGSLLPYGGHNPLEPAACGAAVLTGPHHAAQAAAVAALGPALVVAAAGEGLDAALARVLADSDHRAALGRAARQAVERTRGATRRAVEWLVEWRLWPA
jgi:3-deoxy-D-manno-octulosonic-acid transferase